MVRLLIFLLSFASLSFSSMHAATTESRFNGEDLTVWDGDGRCWRVEDRAIIGETSEDNPGPRNTRLTYVGDQDDPTDEFYRDMLLNFEFQVTGFNSGMQYRSRLGDDHTVTGYQNDFEATWHDGGIDKFTGMFFDEGGRTFLGQRGQAVLVREGDKPKKPSVEVVASVGDQAELAKLIRRDAWNEASVLAVGKSLVHIVNGRVFSLGVDLDGSGRHDSGVFALQLHSGKPMRIKTRKVNIKRLAD